VAVAVAAGSRLQYSSRIAADVAVPAAAEMSVGKGPLTAAAAAAVYPDQSAAAGSTACFALLPLQPSSWSLLVLPVLWLLVLCVSVCRSI